MSEPIELVMLTGRSARWDCLFGRHVWDFENDGRVMEPRCQRIRCRTWMSWEPRVRARQSRRGTWLCPHR